MAGLPLAGMLAGISSLFLIDSIESSSWWANNVANAGDAAMWWGYGLFYVPLWIASLSLGIAYMYYVMQSRFNRSYNEARSILYDTDVPQLIAGGQLAEMLAEKTGQASGIRFPDTTAGWHNSEDLLKLAAANLQLLKAISQSGTATQTPQHQIRQGSLNPVKATAYWLGSVASTLTLGCPFNFGLSCLLGPPLVFFAGRNGLPYAEYLGHLKAICDYMDAELSGGQS